jgi:flagellar biosynthesis/type III secretory pathway M-ring protein FliF/YscJ
MISKELLPFLIQIITSWQVIAVTVVVFLYFFLVSYVAKMYHRSRASLFPSAKSKSKKEKAAPVAAEGDDAGASDDDELGLEEE